MTIDHARAALDAGWNPIPLPPGSKELALPGITGYRGRYLEASDLDAYDWSGNMALRLVPDVIGVDIDVYNGGDITLAELEATHGRLPPAPYSTARSDGSRIAFYTVPFGTTFRTKPGKGIEMIQCFHRYAVCAPSIHPDLKTPYRFFDEAGEPIDMLPHPGELPALPWGWILGLGTLKGQIARSVTPVEADTFLEAHTEALNPSALQGVFTRYGNAAEGERHDSMYAMLCWWARETAAGWYPAGPSLERLEEWWEGAFGQPGSRRPDEGEFGRAVLSAIAQTLTTEGQAEVAAKRAEGERLKQEEALFGQSSTINEDDDEDDDDDDFLIDWTTVHDPEDDLVEGIVIPGRWTQFIAPSKQGKSSLEVFIAIELSEGRNPLDGSSIDPATVLYCDGEMGRADLRELISACGHDPSKLPHLHCSEAGLRLDLKAGALRLLRWVDRLGAKLVILDGLNGFVGAGADENSTNTWNPFFVEAIKPLKRRGVAILSGDNMGKDQRRGARGASAKNDKADGVVAVVRTDKGVRLKTQFGRAGAYADELVLDAEGFDRSKPIRYWRSAIGGWPAGTTQAAGVLDSLKVPVNLGRRKIRPLLAQAVANAEAHGDDPEPFRIRNDVLAAAIRWRKANPIQPSSSGGK